MILDSRKIVIIFSGDHESCQISRVDGEEDDGERSPNIGHESRSVASRTVDGNSCTEQNGPDKPVGSKQRELVVCVCLGKRWKKNGERKNGCK